MKKSTMLLTLVESEIKVNGVPSAIPPMLTVHEAMMIAVRYLRTNHTQHEIAETLGVSQPTVSRAVCALTGVVARALDAFVPTAEDVDLRSTVLVDGTLLPCWSWAGRRDLWSGKHKTTGMNVQVACDLTGRVLWVSDPAPGSTHDMTALKASGLLQGQDPSGHVADKGYQGSDMITPVRKRPSRDLTDNEKEFNRHVSGIRSAIERGNAHLKNWKVLHTDYRRPLNTFATTITATIGLYFFTQPE